MATDREKEREAELEAAMYTNCFLLGLDPSVLGLSGGGGAGMAAPRVGLFRHSNPKMGEQLLYFLLSALRGPEQSAKDFGKVWPIFDSGQSRDFRKIVQRIISELESQGALPRSNSRVSSLATCCGPRFVELLWQLSVHALREVHKRTFPADVASNPLPAPLTDVSYLHASALLHVTKARIALERRKFLKNTNAAVHRQTLWSNLAHEMTAEFRSLCAEEAYLQQELEKLQDTRNRAKLDGEMQDDRVSGFSSLNSHLLTKATRLWESLLSRKAQHEVLASGPIEDLIAHREHRYRISGASLLAAMDQSSHSVAADLLSVRSGETSSPIDNREQMYLLNSQGINESPTKTEEDGNGRVHPTVDVAEILRRWTHALQRIHKQSMQLAKSNDGQGPELLRCGTDSGTSDHSESLAATLAEHRQHLVSIQGLINQLKEAVPAMQKSIVQLTEELHNISSVATDEYISRSTSPVQSSENNKDEVTKMASKLASIQLEKAPSSPLKLPHLFSLTPTSSVRSTQTPRRHALAAAQAKQANNSLFIKSLPFTSEDIDPTATPDNDSTNIQKLKRSVREAALAKPPSFKDHLGTKSEDGSGHFFVPLTAGGILWREVESAAPAHRERPQGGLTKASLNINSTTGPHLLTTPINGFPSRASSQPGEFPLFDEALTNVFSPPLLTTSEFFTDTYEDLLAPLSDTEAALMEH